MDATALQYLRARYYDPATGRFISRDPFPAQAADTQTFNRYVYVKNNPTNYVDPSGEFWNLIVEYGWDALNVAADAAQYLGCSTVAGADCSSHAENLASDSALFWLPFAPAGLTRGAKAVDKAIDAARATKAAAGFARFSRGEIDTAVSLVMSDGNKIRHIFTEKHNMEAAVKLFGTQEGVVRAALNAANGKLPTSGVFQDLMVNVGGFQMSISGNVVDGIPRIGTMWIPSP
jgi:RHS repeat-associated protein